METNNQPSSEFTQVLYLCRMKFEIFFAKRLRLNGKSTDEKSAVSTLNVAIVGMILAIVIMVVSVSVVTGFKETIVDKITHLDSHIKIYNKHYDSDDNVVRSYISYNEELKQLISSKTDQRIKSVNLTSEIPCVLKSPTGFSGLRFKGVPDNYDLSYLKSVLREGKADISGNNALVSKAIADKLMLNVGDRLYIYFMNNQQVRMRRCTVAGIFCSDFDTFDEHILVGNLKTLQSVNQWDDKTGSYLGIECKTSDDADAVRAKLVDLLTQKVTSGETSLTGEFSLSTIRENNPSHFAWLDLLNTNIAVVLGLMAFVACFAIIACLIIVVLNRINTIGVLKALGATNRSIRLIFIAIVMKIIFRAMVIGNVIAFGILFIQDKLHLVKLDSESYFMGYVPVSFNWWLLILNVGIVILAFIALLFPSFIISSIKPAKSIRFE